MSPAAFVSALASATTADKIAMLEQARWSLILGVKVAEITAGGRTVKYNLPKDVTPDSLQTEIDRLKEGEDGEPSRGSVGFVW